MSHHTDPSAIAAVRRFNRFYTRQIGVLDEGHLESAFSLAEVRVLYELAHRDEPIASDIGRDLMLDPGYLSRMLRGFETQGLITREPSPADARQSVVKLTRKGQTATRDLEARAATAIARLLDPLPASTRTKLLGAMQTVETILESDNTEPRNAYTLRSHQPGDMGYIVSRQAILYAREYGWNDEYEALTSRIVADFLEQFDPTCERCWVAERDGEIVGAVFLIRHPERAGVAKLRMLHVEASARGLGLGRQLVHECTLFARQAGYHTITLWTNSVLHSARKIYEAEGYKLVHEAPRHQFGKDSLEQIWDLTL